LSSEESYKITSSKISQILYVISSHISYLVLDDDVDAEQGAVHLIFEKLLLPKALESLFLSSLLLILFIQVHITLCRRSLLYEGIHGFQFFTISS